MFHHRSSTKDKPKQRAAQKAEDRGSVKQSISAASSKQDRINHQKQLQKAKREEILNRKRMGGDAAPPPKVVVIVGFHTQADTLSLKRRLLVACGMAAESAKMVAPHVPVTTVLPPFAQGVPGSGKPRALLIDPPRDLIAVLDAVKVADIVVCTFGNFASLEEPAFDDHGYRVLTALKAQGLPIVVGAIHGAGDDIATSAKKSAEARRFIQRYFDSELGAENKLLPAGTDEEVKALVRVFGSVTPKELTWRQDRAYMLAQEAQYISAEGVLCLRGYLRGPGLRCKYPVHLTGHGDFTVARVALARDPCPLSSNPNAQLSDEKVVDELQAGEDIDRERLRPYDPTEEEQTWPTAEEEKEAKMEQRRLAKIAAPADSSGAAGDSDDDMQAGGGGAADEDGMDADGEGSGDESVDGGASAIAETDDGWEVSSNMTGAGEVPSTALVQAERRRREVLAERSQEDMEFPDEVDLPVDKSAKERFQKFRGLKSFRTSPWDPYEDLPVEYGRIWEFESFSSTARAYKQSWVSECAEVGEGGCGLQYCAVYIKGVPPSVMENQPQGQCFIMSNLFPCEQKVSVVHGHVTRQREYTEVLKSKQEVMIHCGFRRFPGRPIYSEIPKKASTCKKFKFARFFRPESTVCASFYAPIVFAPSRMLMFGSTPEGPELIASGNIAGADPKQLIIKRAIMTGYPFRVHKTKGVVRFMFFNPTDIRWFKPVELMTKKGLRGHITESLGMHGYMKCRFSAHIKQDDTVCMNLYKRVYPKWHPPSWGGSLEDTPQTAPQQ